MKRTILLFSLLLSVACHAQDFCVSSVWGDVVIRSAREGLHPARQKERLNGDDVLTVSPGGLVTLNREGTDLYLSVGPTEGESVNSITKRIDNSIWKRVASVIKGVDTSGQMNAALKGEDVIPDYLYAAAHPDYVPYYQVGFDLIRNGAVMTDVELKDGDHVYFRIRNEEKIPLFVGLIWEDTLGEPLDCLGQLCRFLLLPPQSSVDLSEAWLEIAPPYGQERILLFASEEPFYMPALLQAYPGREEAVPSGCSIGFCQKVIHTYL